MTFLEMIRLPSFEGISANAQKNLVYSVFREGSWDDAFAIEAIRSMEARNKFYNHAPVETFEILIRHIKYLQNNNLLKDMLEEALPEQSELWNEIGSASSFGTGLQSDENLEGVIRSVNLLWSNDKRPKAEHFPEEILDNLPTCPITRIGIILCAFSISKRHDLHHKTGFVHFKNSFELGWNIRNKMIFLKNLRIIEQEYGLIKLQRNRANLGVGYYLRSVDKATGGYLKETILENLDHTEMDVHQFNQYFNTVSSISRRP